MDNCLKFMCDVIKVRIHPTRRECWLITEEMEEIEIDSIGRIVSAPLKFKETNGQIVPLTEEVFVRSLLYVYNYIVFKFKSGYYNDDNHHLSRKLPCTKLRIQQSIWLVAERL